MGRVAQPDENRIAQLQSLLESKGVDVVRVGSDLTMPSPFKERRKGTKDDKRRLSVTVVTDGGEPAILWQCWFSKRPDGTNFGGRSAYAIAIVAGMTQEEILTALDMCFDAEEARADDLCDQIQLIIDRQERIQARAAATVPCRPHQRPPSLIPLGSGSELTWRGEELISSRRISIDVARYYGLAWDLEMGAVYMPWNAPGGEHVYGQWWNPEWAGRGYRFPPRDNGLMSKEDAIFGIDRWTKKRPLILCEGAFDAMTVGGCHLGGSTLTTAQLAIIKSLSVPAIILAFDRDSAGITGSQHIAQTLRAVTTNIITVFPPTKDWNDLAMATSAEQALAVFIQRVREAQSDGGLVATICQMLG